MKRHGISNGIRWCEDENMDFREEIKELFDDPKEDIYDCELKSYSEDFIVGNKGKLPPLFRYSDADYYSIRGLETQSLYLSENGVMNDLFEGLTCNINDQIIAHIDDMNDLAFIKSFSEIKSSNLMWAHYANKYKGICIEYDFSKLNNDILFHLFPVFYTNFKKEDMGLQYTIEEHLDLKQMNYERSFLNDVDYLKDIMHLFLIKSKDWEYEKEWRLLFTYPQLYNSADDVGDEDCREFYNIHSQTISVENCIKSVYLGARIEKIKKDHIVEICKKLGIKVYSSVLAKEKYELIFNEID